jgi:hypothetical protein
MNGTFVDYLIVAALGILVGSGELVSRYRDAPARALANGPAFFYVLLNALASISALFVIHTFNWHFGVTGGGETLRWTQVGAAGTGAMALFRSSLFTVQAGGQDISIGPVTFLQVFRDASDRAVDRLQARTRGIDVSQLMEGVSYEKASHGLTTYCLALMQNVPDDEQVALTKSLALLDGADIPPEVKVRILALNLMNVVGPNVLKAAVDSLRKQMASDGAQTPT